MRTQVGVFERQRLCHLLPSSGPGCRSLTHFVRRGSISLGVVCGLSEPVDGRRGLGMWFPALELMVKESTSAEHERQLCLLFMGPSVV